MPTPLDIIVFRKPQCFFSKLLALAPKYDAGLYLSIDGPARSPINVIASIDTDGIFKITCEAAQFRQQVKGEEIFRIRLESGVDHAQRAIRQVLGASSWRGEKLTGAKAVAYIFGHDDWASATVDTLLSKRIQYASDN